MEVYTLRLGDWQVAARLCVAAEDWRTAPMISDSQQEALAVLTEVCGLSPDVRLGQLLAQLGFQALEFGLKFIWNLAPSQEVWEVSPH